MDSIVKNGDFLLQRISIFEQLEERIVLDAAVPATTQDNADNDSGIESDGESGQTAAGEQGDSAGGSTNDDSNASQDPLGEIYGQPLHVVLVSSALGDIENLQPAIEEGATTLTYDHETADLASIVSDLQDLVATTGQEIGQIAILSHGEAGVIMLAQTESWTISDLESNSEQWAALGGLLAEDARIDLYGCDIGYGTAGLSLVESIAELTGATIWASDDETGNVDGSDWDLEVRSADSDLSYLIHGDSLTDTSISLSQSFGNVGFEDGTFSNWGVSGSGSKTVVEAGEDGNPNAPYVGSNYIAYVTGTGSTGVATLASEAFITNEQEAVRLSVKVDYGMVKWGLYVMYEGRKVPGTTDYEITNTGGSWETHTVDLSWFFTDEGLGRKCQIHIDIQGYSGHSANAWIDVYESENPYVYRDIPTQNGAEDQNMIVNLDPTTPYFKDDNDTGNLTFSVVSYSSSFLESATVSGDILTLIPKDNKYGDTSVTVQAMDSIGLTEVTTFTAHFGAVQDPPTDLNINNWDVDENLAVGATVGNFSSSDPDGGETFTYSLVSGTGSDDNSYFYIDGSVLKTNAVFNYEAKDQYSIRVQTKDSGNNTYQEVFTIDINDKNEPITGLNLNNTDVDENSAAGTLIGTFSSVDQDTSDSYTYSFVGDSADYPGNLVFEIQGDKLVVKDPLDFESIDSYAIMVRTEDSAHNTFDREFTITINDVNDAPTGLNLDNTDVDENSAAGTLIGTFSSVDQDAGETFTYTFVGGYPGNSVFEIQGDKLVVKDSLDFESTDSYTIKVRTEDSGNETFDREFTITINDVNDAPTDISMTDDRVDENQAVGTVVGEFSAQDQDAGATHTYQLVDSGSYPDNNVFVIDGAQLKTAASFNYETKDEYQIKVEVTDNEGATYQEAFTIYVDDINDAPTGLNLDNTDVDENSAAGTLIGNFSSVDEDAGETFTYSFVGDSAVYPGNSVFEIQGDTLVVKDPLDFESTDSYTIKVRTEDSGNETFDREFTITINDVNDAPTDISLTNNRVDENQAIGVVVGEFSAQDQDAGATHTYQLVDSGSYPDNSAFVIDGAQLKTAASFDYESQDEYQIKVEVTDNEGATYQETLTIYVNDINDAPELNNSGAPFLDAIDEDDGSNSGTLVSDIIARCAGGDPITDQDSGAVEGIAVIWADTSRGAWEYTLNGVDWFALAAVTDNSATLLASDATTSLRFVPSQDYNGDVDPAIGFRAWDMTAGANGQSGVDASSNGGITPYSSNSETASITVQAVNDAPVNFIPAEPQTMNEDSFLIFNDENGNRISVGDVDANDSSGELRVTLETEEGTLKLGQTDGLTFIGDDYEDEMSQMTFTGSIVDINAALDGLTFTPWADYFGSAEIAITTNDLGATGSGGALTGFDIVEISIADVPEDVVGNSSQQDQDTPYTPSDPGTGETTDSQPVVDTVISVLEDSGLLPNSGGSQVGFGLPGYEEDSGHSGLVTVLGNYLNEAIFGEDQSAQDQAWQSLMDFAHEFSTYQPQDQGPSLESFFYQLHEALQESGQDLFLQFQTGEASLYEWLQSLLTPSTGGDLGLNFVGLDQPIWQDSGQGSALAFIFGHTEFLDLCSSPMVACVDGGSFQGVSAGEGALATVFSVNDRTFMDLVSG